jgi:hypothetical protein
MSAVQSKTPKRGKRISDPAEREAFKAERREEERARIEASVRELMTSEGWARWARTRSAFHTYSLCNTLLIAQQMPSATMVAGYRTWQSIGRQVRKGQAGIRIMAPMQVKRRKDSAGDLVGKIGISDSRTVGQIGARVTDAVKNAKDADYERLTLFRAVSVFDVSQTDGEELPELPCEPIEGDTHGEYLPKLVAFGAELGYTVGFEDLGAAIGGYCRRSDSSIVVSTRGSVNRQVRTLVHELAHALGIHYDEYGREAAEVIVETAAVIVCGSIGLDTAGESIPYIARWGMGDDVAAIRTYAQKVDECASRIEKALGVRS